ncbi:unannotated protein [freshwater metagenome]|uniref:Unannotated protein n=1 Tax=freshwater metagenome TaxID=449393 RepID=A0A6J6FV31_9ZZZZ
MMLAPVNGPFEEIALNLKCRRRTSASQWQCCGEREIGAHGSERVNGCRKPEVSSDPVVFNHRQNDGGGTDLQKCRHLAHVRVSDDDVKAAVLLGVRVGLVSRIDDWSLQRRFETDLFLEKISTLTDLEGYELGREPKLTSDFPCTTENLSGDEMRCDLRNDSSEGQVSIDEVVLVTSVRVPFPIRVVLVRNDRLALG